MKARLSDSAVLEALRSILDSDSLSQSLAYVLRVPEAWSQLHDTEFMDRVIASKPSEPITPSRLTSIVINDSNQEFSDTSVPADMLSRLQELLQTILQGTEFDNHFDTLALVAVGIARYSETEDGALQIAKSARQHPHLWRSALSCAWGHIQNPRILLESLLDGMTHRGISLATNMLLANIPLPDAAEQITKIVPDAWNQLAIPLRDLGELEFEKELIRNTEVNISNHASTEMNPKVLLTKAIREITVGAYDEARENLNQAWGATEETAASIADQIAESAILEGDGVLEIEARKRALSSRPSPRRRANLLLSLANHNKTEDALSFMEQETKSLEEQIAYGITAIRRGEKDRALNLLLPAKEAISNTFDVNGRWYNALSSGLQDCGEAEKALEVARKNVDRIPSDYDVRSEYVRMLSSHGDYGAAAEQADLFLGMYPDSTEARQLLAANLQRSGAANASLPHWDSLARLDPKYLWEFAESALQANEASIAEENVVKLLESNPDSLQAKVLLGRTYAAQARFDSAREQIQKALELNSELEQAWIALAETEYMAGNIEIAIDVMTKAIARSPQKPSLFAAQADYLRQKGQLDESAQSYKKATELEPTNVEWLLQYGEVLDALGRDDMALATLNNAHSLEPLNWGVRMALAKVHEKFHEHALAAGLLSHLPDYAPAEAHYLAGRAIVKSNNHKSERLLVKAVDHLQIALDSGVTDPALNFYIGSAQENLGEHDLALQNYQSSLKVLHESKDDTYKQALMGTARTALATNNLPIALTTLETAQEKFPKSTDILLQLSHSYLSAGMLEQALHVAQQAVELEPENLDAQQILRDSAVSMNHWNQAIQATKRILDIHPDRQHDWIELAEYTQRINHRSEARDTLARALAIDRRDPTALLKTTKLLIELDEPAYARINLKHALANANSDADTFEELAKTSYVLGDLECEQEAWTRMLEIEPDNLNALTRCAQALWNLNRHTSAIGLWQRAVEIDGNRSDIKLKLGRAYIESGEPQRGLDHILDVYKASPTSADLAKETGNLLLRYRSPLDALEVLQRAVQLSPNDIDSIMDLGNCYLQLSRYEEAEITLTQAKETDPYPIRIDALLAQIALIKGDIARAEQLLNTACQAEPMDIEDVLCISEAATRLGHWNEAVKTLEDTLSKSEDIDAGLALIKLRLRLADAHWLYATMGASLAHAPASECGSVETQNEVNSLIDRFYKAGVPKQTIDKLKRWASFTFGSNSEDETIDPVDPSIDDWSTIAQAHAISLFKTGKAASAIEILEADPNNIDPDSWGAIILGLCHTSLGDTTQAIQAFNIASRNLVVQPLVSFFASETLWQAGEVEDALSSLNLALSAWPDEVTWHSIAASRYQDLSKYDAAVAHLQQAVELAPQDPEILHTLAHALRDSGQLSESLTYYKQVIETSPERKTAWREAAEVAMANGKAKTAQKWFEHSSRLFPSDPNCLIGAARAAMSQGKSDQAVSYIEAAARMAPENLEVLVGLGEILASQGKYEKAMRAYDQAIKSSNGEIEIRIGRCKLLIRIGRSEHAISELHTLLEENPHNVKLHSTLAEAYQADGDLENAIEAATQATLLSPRDPGYRYQVGRLCRLAGQLDRALDELLQAQSTAPTQARISRELGQVHEQRRETRKALDAYRRALELDSQDELSHYRAGMILKQQKAYPQAARLLERAIELNPKDSEVIQQLAAVRALELVHGGL